MKGKVTILVKSGNAHFKIYEMGRNCPGSFIWLFKNTLSILKHSEKKCQRKPLRYVGTGLTDHEDKSGSASPCTSPCCGAFLTASRYARRKLNPIDAGTSGTGVRCSGGADFPSKPRRPPGRSGACAPRRIDHNRFDRRAQLLLYGLTCH